MDLALERPLAWRKEMPVLARYGDYMLTVAALTMGNYIWFLPCLLPRGHGLRLPLYRQIRVLKSLRAAHGFIGSIFIISFSFRSFDDGIMITNILQTALTIYTTIFNMLALVYYPVL